MSLVSGTKLGPYEVLDLLGAGGMGEVYRARDTRLDRTVALKVLSSALIASPEVKQRFEREARSLSSISHPHICALYDIGTQDGIDFLIMEYVQGDTVDRRLARGPFSTSELLQIAIQLADALDKAHRQGLVHRDIKPANVMLTRSGAKLMDFGLAKPSTSPITGHAFSAVATMTSPAVASQSLTGAGMIVGTLHYMSPEQIQGQEADARSDIFSFGALLYEMATARRPFSGKTQASVIASILAIEPTPVSTIQPSVPPPLDRIIRNCLEKDPAERLQSAHDLKLELQAIAEMGPSAAMGSGARLSRGVLAVAAGVLCLGLLLGFATAAWMRPTAAPAAPLRSVITLPKDVLAPPWQFALSPDGTKLAFMARKQGNQMLWLRSMDSLTVQPLAGTEDASYPFWSPDSRTIGFFAGEKLKKIDAGGGPVVSIANVGSGRGGSWSRDGVIIFADQFGGLKTIAASGGPMKEVTHVQGKETTHRWPEFLPDGRHVVFLSDLIPQNSSTSAGSLLLLDLKTGKTQFLTSADSDARYDFTGFLLYVVQGNLMAQPFDGAKFTGDPAPIAEAVAVQAERYKGGFSISQTGVLTFMSGSGELSQLTWFDRKGAPVKALMKPGIYDSLNLSPDGQRVAYTLHEGNKSDIWIDEVARDVPSRLTSTEDCDGAVWSKDGKQITYARNTKGVFSRLASAVGAETQLVGTGDTAFANDWTADGKSLLYMRFANALGVPRFWIHPSGGAKDFPLTQTVFVEADGRFSPDGKFLAYLGSESGPGEVYVVPFPSLSEKWKISNGGGYQPRWSRTGNELFFIDGEGKIISAKYSVKNGKFQVQSLTELFQTKIAHIQLTLDNYDVSPDGSRFLVNAVQEQGAVPFTVLTNWRATIKK